MNNNRRKDLDRALELLGEAQTIIETAKDAGLVERYRGHTPGPWEAAEPGGYGDFDGQSQVILGDDIRIGVVQGVSEESAAKARLVADAPALLARLTALSARNAVLEEVLMAVPISNWVGLTIGDTKIRSWEEARAFLQRLIPLTTKETKDAE